MPDGTSNPYPVTPNRGPTRPSDLATWVAALEARVDKLEATQCQCGRHKPVSDPKRRAESHYRWDDLVGRDK